MKYLVVFLLLLAVGISTGVLTASSLKLEKGKHNQLTFACGAVEKKTGKTGVYTDNYTYTFKGYPTWLTPKGNSLVGTVPASANSDYSVTVNYRSPDGKKTGSQVCVLSASTGQLTTASSTSSSTSKQTTTATKSTGGGLLGAIVGGVLGLFGAGGKPSSQSQPAPSIHRFSYFQGIFDTKRVVASAPGNLVVLCPVLPATQPLTKPIITDVVDVTPAATAPTTPTPTIPSPQPPATTTPSTSTTPPVDIGTVVPVDPSTVPVDPSTVPVDSTEVVPVDPQTVPVDPAAVAPVDPEAVPPVDPSTVPVDSAVVPVDPSTVVPVDPSTVSTVPVVATPLPTTPVTSTPTTTSTVAVKPSTPTPPTPKPTSSAPTSSTSPTKPTSVPSSHSPTTTAPSSHSSSPTSPLIPRYTASSNTQDYSCGSTSTAPNNWSGTGVVTAVGTDSITLDNKWKVNIGKCTQKSFSGSSRNTFRVKDHVNYTGYRGTGTQWTSSGWARNIWSK